MPDNSDADKAKGIINIVVKETKEELQDALKETINLGRTSILEFIKIGGSVVSPANAKIIADLYLTAETAVLAGNTIYANSIIERLNIAVAAYGTIYKSKSAKRLMAMWQSALSILTKLIRSVGSIASGGLTGLVDVGINAVTDAVNEAATKAGG